MLGYENSKQFTNNPLKDISNQVGNSSAKIQTPATVTTSKFTVSNNGNGRYSMMPFDIAPKLKINNYLDQPFKQIAPAVKTAATTATNESMPFQVSPNTSSSKFLDKSSPSASTVSVSTSYKIANFEE
jgi:hypothetical protein